MGIKILSTLKEAEIEGKGWKVCLIKAGLSLNNYFYPSQMLKESVHLFEGSKAYVDHSNDNVSRSVRDIAGWFENVHFENDELDADFYISEGQPWLKTMMKDAWARGKSDLLGFSIMALGESSLQKEGIKSFFRVDKLNKVASIDVVAVPAAGGRILSFSESLQEEKSMLENVTLEDLTNLRPDLIAAIMSAKVKAEAVVPPIEDEEAKKKKAAELKKNAEAAVTDTDKDVKMDPEEYKKMMKKNMEDILTPLISPLKASIDAVNTKVQRYELSAVLQRLIGEATLPDISKNRLTESFKDRSFTSEDVSKAIKAEVDYLGALEGTPKPAVTSVKIGANEIDKFRKAMDGMMAGKSIDGIKPFRGLKEAYSYITGTQVLDIMPERMLGESAGFASWMKESVAVSTWAEILGDSITRKMLAEYSEMPLDDWRKIVSDISPVNDFRTQRRQRMGGYGNLPAVNEGGTYQSLTSPTDEEATYAVTKRGGLEDLTLETIRNDDLGAVRRIPIRLARTAKITLSQFVFDFLKDNPTMTYDSVALFNAASHVNTTTSALSDATLSTAKQAMRAQNAYGSTTDFLNLVPRLLVVPVELEQVALHMRSDEYAYQVGFTFSSTALQSRENNIHRNTFDILVVPYWTDADNWYLVADPKLVPTIEMGFLDGKEDPELFTQEQPTVGSVFTADKITYKIRHIYGGTVVDHRGFYGGIV